MISSSIWHCDYCLGDICCCIKSNLPFLSSIVTMPELFSFFFKKVEMIPRNTPERQHGPAFGWGTLRHALWWFLPFSRPLGWQIAHFLSGGKAFSLSVCICMHRMWPFPVLQWGCQPFPLSLWHLATGIAPAASSWVSAPAAEMLLQNKTCPSHLCRWKGLFQDGSIRGQMVALGYALKGWSSEVLLPILGESSTQHLAKTQSRYWRQQQRGKRGR